MPSKKSPVGSPPAAVPAELSVTAPDRARSTRPAAKASGAVVAKTPIRQPRPNTDVGAKVERAEKSEKAKAGQRLVRDSFTIPKSEYAVLQQLKQRAIALARPAKKSELLRAGIAALHTLNDKAFLAALSAVPCLKTGRPKASAGTGRKQG